MTNQETNKLYSCVHSMQEANVVFLLCHLENETPVEKQICCFRFGCWLFARCCWCFQSSGFSLFGFFPVHFIIFVVAGKKGALQRMQYVISHSLWKKYSYANTVNCGIIQFSLRARVCVCRFFLFLSCALEISFEAYMFYRGDKIMLKFVQHSAKYPLFSQRLRELLQFQAKPDTDRTLYRNLNGSIGCFESKNLLFSLGLTSTDPKSAGVWVRKMAAV